MHIAIVQPSPAQQMTNICLTNNYKLPITFTIYMGCETGCGGGAFLPCPQLPPSSSVTGLAASQLQSIRSANKGSARTAATMTVWTRADSAVGHKARHGTPRTELEQTAGVSVLGSVRSNCVTRNSLVHLTIEDQYFGTLTNIGMPWPIHWKLPIYTYCLPSGRRGAFGQMPPLDPRLGLAGDEGGNGNPARPAGLTRRPGRQTAVAVCIIPK